MDPLHLYIRYPFCAQNQTLSCFAAAPAPDTRRTDYLCAIRTEILHTAPDFADEPVASLCIGGGEPLLAGAEQLTDLLRTVRQNFTLAPDAEVTIDVSPAFLTAAWMVQFQNMGITRIALNLVTGRQKDYDRFRIPGSLASAQTCLMLPQIFSIPHYAGLLLYGLPDQTPDQFLVSTRFCCKYNAPEIIFEPFCADADKFLTVPARENLLSKGYLEYLPDHFARPGFEGKQEMARISCEPFLSFGAGTRSCTDGIIYETVSSIPEYIRQIDTPEHLYHVLGTAGPQNPD